METLFFFVKIEPAPFSQKQAEATNGSGAVIVPLGSLVRELGCTVTWTKRGLQVVHPEHGVITTHVSGACPFIGEAKALELIGELENRKLEHLKAATVENQLRMHGMEAQLNYGTQLAEYRRTGKREEGLKALMCEDSLFGCLTEAQRCALAQDIDLSDKAGHRYLKALPVKRAMRKRLMSTQWLVHLYSGEGGSAEFKTLEDSCVTLLEIDLSISRAFNMRGPSVVYRALLWAAMRGQLHGLIGGPPRGEGCGELVLKQMFLWNIARIVAEEHEVSCPIFAMTLPRRSELWKSTAWRSFKEAMGLSLSLGASDVVLATNMIVKDSVESWERTSATGAIIWTEEFRRALVRAVVHQRSRVALYRMEGPLSSMSKEELAKWLVHVRNGHIPFHKRCQTCVATRATGHQHRRVEAPSCNVMSVDVCGPFRKKGQSPDGMNYKYMLVASYTMPVIKGRRVGPEDEIVNEEAGGVGDIDLGCDPEELPVKGPEPTGDPEELPVKGPEPAGDPEELPVKGPEPTGDPEELPVKGPEPAGDPEELPVKGPEQEVESDGEQLGQERSPPDLDELFAEEEDVTEGAVKPEEQGELDRLNREYNELVGEVGDVLNYQVLRFAVPMTSRRSAEVNSKMRELYLQIRAEGLEVVRCHSDRATELCNSRLRDWFCERGVLCTTGEAQTPQQNGRAEASVKFVKSHCRTLLTAARLPAECWPLAMSYATHKQRHDALGKGGDLPSFGAPVHVRTKVYGRAGRYDVENKWRQGVYVGPSSDVQHGHCVRFPDGSFVTSLHLKDQLVDADGLVDLVPREIELPVPDRRVREKRRLAMSHVHPLSIQEEKAEIKARHMWRTKDFGVESILDLFELLKEIKNKRVSGRAATKGVSWTTGMFVHGGVAGLRENTRRLKWTAKCLVEAGKKLTGGNSFTAVGILENKDMGCHKDSHNEVDSMNTVVMLKLPESGGELWLEDETLHASEADWKRVSKKIWKKGACHDLKVGEPYTFNPRRWHEVQPWEGNRVVMVLHNPRASHLHYQDRDDLEYVGFPLKNDLEISSLDPEDPSSPSVQVHASGLPGDESSPELYLIRPLDTEGRGSLEDALITLTEEQEHLLQDLQERADRLRLLLEEEHAMFEECRQAGRAVTDEIDNVTAAIEDMIQDVTEQQKVKTEEIHTKFLKTVEATEEIDYEQLLRDLDGDLEVVHTVPLHQVRAALDQWTEALEKEVKQLLGGTLRPISLSKAKELERQGLLRLVPSKGVFTLKPPAEKGCKVRRKFRLVLCGNYVQADGEAGELYAGGVSADTVRLALAFASSKRWCGGTSDVTGAFLLAEWPEHLARYAIFPPKVLVEAGLASPHDAWEVVRPLYGLRESPSIWAKWRTARLRDARINYQGRVIVLRQSTADPELWLAYDEDNTLRTKGTLLALLITYVDDLLYLADRPLVEALHAWVQQEWPCSPLEWADGVHGTRYLGMEIQQVPSGAFELSQIGYIRELLRGYGLDEAVEAKLPCPKDWLQEEEPEEVENFSNAELKAAQRIVGEHMWLTLRCRPDLQFPVMQMASKVSKQPNRVLQIGKRLLCYLKATQSLKLVMGVDCEASSSSSCSSKTTDHNKEPRSSGNDAQHTDNSAHIYAYSDASFAPFGERSFGACAVVYLGSVISWKASKQAFVTLSVMEAELYETTNAVVLVENVGCLLDELLGERATRILKVDNASAIALLQGGPGSWRTRHLKVRSAKLRDMVENGEIFPEHVAGELQVADLATKAHPKMRLWELLSLWGFRGLPSEAVKALNAKSVYLSMLTLAMMMQTVRAEESGQERTRLQSVGVDELLVVTVLVCVAAVATWEAMKWMARCVRDMLRESPKQRRLRKLREAAKAAAEEEVDRAFLSRSGQEERLENEEPRLSTELLLPPPPPPEIARPAKSTKRIIERAPSPPPPIGPEFELFPENGFYKTVSSRSKLHTNPHCHGLRNSGDVYAVEYCAYCQRNVPLYTKRSRSLQPSRSA